ncbi:ditrans,polycis-polyprenyl diphosphate synthase [(2E,6E)-farnesyl], partial [Sarracenia purpurea var. burkii]
MLSFFGLFISVMFYVCRTMDVGDEQQKVFCSPGQFGNFVLLLLWHILHFIISIWYCVLGIAHVLESYLASSGLLKRYGVVNLDKLRYLAVVVDNDEAYQTSKVTELLQWLAVVGVKNVCLYDAEGVLKKSKEAILGKLHVAKLFKCGDLQLVILVFLQIGFLEFASQETTKNVPLLDQQQIHLEFASYSDGKEAVAKAANLLFVKYYLGRDQEEPIFTESHIAEALGTV